MERIPENVDSKFRFVLLAATRAEQLMRGANVRLEHPFFKNTRTAMEEIITEQIPWEYGPDEPLEVEGEEGEAAAEGGEAAEMAADEATAEAGV